MLSQAISIVGRPYTGQPLTRLCYFVECALEDVTKELELIPESYDLRETGLSTPSEDEGSCGSCWAFVVKSCAESNILANAAKYNSTPFNVNAKALSVSVQYILNTTKSSYYCSGGDAASALWERKKCETEELTQHFPYVADKNPYPTHIEVQNPVLNPQQYVLPYQYYSMPRINETTQVIRVVQNPHGNALSQTEVRKMKEWLAQGIPLITEMYVDDLRSGYEFETYYGARPLSGNCRNGTNNHEVIIVGYGKYKGVDSWAIKNSWGRKWGQDGHFYAEINTNAYCLEEFVFAAVPESYDLANPQLFGEQRESAFSLQRGLDGFDNRDGTYHSYTKQEAIAYNIVGWLYAIAVYGLLWALQLFMDHAIIGSDDHDECAGLIAESQGAES